MNELPWPIGEYVYHHGAGHHGAVIAYDSSSSAPYTILLDRSDDHILLNVRRESFRLAERQDSEGEVMNRHAIMCKLQDNLIIRLDSIIYELDQLYYFDD